MRRGNESPWKRRVRVDAGPRIATRLAEPGRAHRGWRRAAVALALALASGSATPAETGAPNSADAGERLFAGEVRFANGGPPSAACHAAAGLRFPGGGSLGPDLTDAYSKYGPEPLDVVLTTLFVPTMNPLFAGRPLTAAERAELTAFLASRAGQAPAAPATPRMLAYGVLAFAAAAALIAWLGRSRLRGVRAALVRARRSQETPP